MTLLHQMRLKKGGGGMEYDIGEIIVFVMFVWGFIRILKLKGWW